MNKLMIKNGREKSLKRLHPWIFSGAVAEIAGTPENGELLQVCDTKGNFIALASYSAKSQITGRVWTFDRNEKIDLDFFRRKVTQAIELRKQFGLFSSDQACRLIASEGDYLPGVVADYYAGYLVVQFLSAGAEYFRDWIINALAEETGAIGIYERSDASVRKLEGLTESAGTVYGAEAPELIEFMENGIKFQVNVRKGHKTGFYLDQRDARQKTMAIAAGKRVLNVFSYTGGFGVAAMKGGAASVVNVDSSTEAQAQGKENFKLNGIDCNKVEDIRQDAFTCLRELDAKNEKFDLVILDPPKLIDGMASLERGCRAYKDLARLGCRLLNPGGMLMNFSCSGLMTPELFQKITADGALDAGRTGRIVGSFRQGMDHPVALSTPESFYLKGLCTVCI